MIRISVDVHGWASHFAQRSYMWIMSIVFLIIIGAAAGFLATRLMGIETDLVTTVAIGIAGALIGGLILRFLLVLTGFAAGFIGALLGAMLLIWVYRTYLRRR